MSSTTRPFLAFHTLDQWRGASHRGTAVRPLAGAEESVESGSAPFRGEVCDDPRFQNTWPAQPWSSPFEAGKRASEGVWEVLLQRQELGEAIDVPIDAEAELPLPAGLAFDPWCRLYHSVPEEGRVERLLWGAQRLEESGRTLAPTSDVFAAPAEVRIGDFHTSGGATRLRRPSALAIDDDGRLFAAEAGSGAVFIFDLWDRRLLQVIRPAAGRVVDLASTGSRVLALMDGPPRLFELDARGDRREVVLPEGVVRPGRLAVSIDGGVALLDRARRRRAIVWELDIDDASAPGEGVMKAPFATDIEYDGDGALAVARRPGEVFQRASQNESELTGRGYDGRGLVRTPEGRIAFWTELGLREAVEARARYKKRGLVTSYRLDGGDYRTIWGRLFVDACVPDGTELRVHFATADEEIPGPKLERDAPPGLSGEAGGSSDESREMPPMALLPTSDEPLPHLLHRRGDTELAWESPQGSMQTFESPVHAPPGRFLWVTLELLGNGSRTPRVHALRMEKLSHDLLRRLPKAYSRDAAAESFLRRYLAPLEGVLADLDVRALTRHALVDPQSCPEEMLDWLAGFVGLVLDRRCPVAARRRLIAEAAWLFRFRGTPSGLRRFLEVCLDRPVLFLEHYRVRGLGGAVVGADGDLLSSAILGGGFRVGGAIGSDDASTVGGDEDPDAFDEHAHRFTVVVVGGLSEDELAVTEHVLEIHRPAHTLYDLCSVDAGMRVGVALYVEITSQIGRSGGFRPITLGGSVLGGESILGQPRPGLSPSGSRTGLDSRVG